MRAHPCVCVDDRLGYVAGKCNALHGVSICRQVTDDGLEVLYGHLKIIQQKCRRVAEDGENYLSLCLNLAERRSRSQLSEDTIRILGNSSDNIDVGHDLVGSQGSKSALSKQDAGECGGDGIEQHCE